MYIVKSIKPAGSRLAVTLEKTDAGCDEFSDDDECTVCFAIGKEFLKPFALKAGDLIGDEVISELAEAALLSDAVAKALDVLSYSNHSVRSLSAKLHSKYSIDKDKADAASQYCVDHGYIDEKYQAEKFAASAVRSKCWGKSRITRELYAKGYPMSVCKEAALSVGDGEYEAALEKTVAKKVKSRPKDRAELLKAVRQVAALGHTPRDAGRKIKELFEENN